jgi:hypothetical protein
VADQYADFFIAAAAAAPIIALANQVVLSDSLGLQLLFRRKRSDSATDVKNHATRGYRFAIALFLVGYINLVAQILVLTAALYGLIHIQRQPTMGLPTVMALVESLGLVLVLVSSVLSGYVRDAADQLKDAQL